MHKASACRERRQEKPSSSLGFEAAPSEDHRKPPPGDSAA